MRSQGAPSSGGLNAWATANVVDAGGELTEEEILEAARAIASRPPQPQYMLTSQAMIDEGRRQADIACAVALFARSEVDRMPRWRWMRRRYLWRIFDEQADNAEMLWRTFGVGG